MYIPHWLVVILIIGTVCELLRRAFGKDDE